MNTKTWILPVLSALLFADTVLAATLYENDFEALGKLNFRGSFGPRWIGDLKTAERQGHVKIHRKGLCEQGEKSHSGMRPASPMVRRKRDFLEWEFTKKMNAVGL